MKEQVRYYKNLTTDDFAGTKINTEKVPADYRYIDRRPVYKVGEFFVYRVVARPLITVYMKVRFHQRFKNKRVLKKIGRQGAFLYGNHTLLEGDAFIPNMAFFGRKNYIIAGADAVSIPGIRTLVKMLGAIPLPDTTAGYRNFRACISARVGAGATITVFPEAHIWPYYTGIRPFPATSFHYPVELNAPVYVLTNTYHKKRFGILPGPRIVTYVDGPFVPDPSMPKKSAMEDLRTEVLTVMEERAAQSDYEYIKYLPTA